MGIWRFNVATESLALDERARQLYDVDRTEVAASDMEQRIAAADRERIRSEWIAAMAPGSDGSFQTEYRLFDRGGQLRWLSVRARFQFQNSGPERRPILAVGTVVDITKQKLDDAALQAAEYRQRLALDAGGMGTWDWDIARGKVVWDTRQEELFGMRPGEYDGSEHGFFQRVHPDDQPFVRRMVARALEEGIDFDAEFRAVRPDGQIRWLVGSGRMIRGDDQLPARMVGINYDITERKASEELIVASLREKEAMLKEIHHRVKNNLQVVSSLLNLQAERIDDPGARAVFLESQSRIRAMALVHETLYGSESLAGIEMSPYICRLCDSLMQTYRRDDRVNLELNVAATVFDLDHALPVGLIVSELVSNALKYAFPSNGRGTISVCIDSPNGADCQLVISDDGVGLPESFDPETSTTLGLYLVRLLVRQICGTMSVKRSNGVSFTIGFSLS